jgi:flagellar hook-associated protein 2
MTSITSLGLGSGLDLEALIGQLVAAEGTPEQLRISQQEAEYQAELSALGSFRSALDIFNTALEALADLESFNKRIATSGNEALFTVTADTNAVSTAHDIEVVRLAQAHKLSSAGFATADTVVGTGQLTLAVGDQSVTIDIDAEHATLAQIRDAINGAENNPGVQAVIVNGDDGAHLVLTSSQTGEAGAITVTASGGDGGLSALVYDPLNGTTNLTEVQQAVDAEVRIDGITVGSASNDVSDAIEGVTIHLVSASPGVTARLSVELDVESTRTAINNFVAAYNTLQTTLDGLTSYDAATKVAGPLLGDSMVLMFEDQLRRDVSDAVAGAAGAFDTLFDIGITTDFENGTLKVDEDVLNEALENHFDDLGQLFASEDGYAVRMQTIAESYLETDGLIEVRTDGIQSSIDGLAEDQEQLNAHLEAYEDRLRDQFTALDQLVAELTATSEFLAQQLALLPSFNATGT